MSHISLTERSYGNIAWHFGRKTLLEKHWQKKDKLIPKADPATLSHLFETIVNNFSILRERAPS